LLLSGYQPVTHPQASLALPALMAFQEVGAALVVLLPALVVLEEVVVGRDLLRLALAVPDCYLEAEEPEEELQLDC